MLKKLLFTTSVSIVLLTQSIQAIDTIEDICYYDDEVILDPVIAGGCVDVGPFRGGFNCNLTVPLRNISGEALTDTTIVWDIDAGFNANMVEKCGIDGTAGGCRFDATIDIGGLRMFENSITYEPMPTFEPSGSGGKHSIFFYNLMQGNFSPLTMFTGDDLYATYTKDGTEYAGRIGKCHKTKVPVEDLCYNRRGITYDGAMCVDFGPFKGGMGCRQNIPIRSLTDQNLTSVEIALELHGMNGNFLGGCGIDEDLKGGLNLPNGDCQDKAFFNFGPMQMMARGVFFDPMADYDAPYEKHSIFVQTLMNMSFDPVALFTGTNLYAHYTKEGTDVAGPIPACPESREPVEDLCYETPIDYSPGLNALGHTFGVCTQFGPFKGGMGCKEKIVIRSITDKHLLQVDMFLDTHGMNASFLGSCGIDDAPAFPNVGCAVQERFDFGPMGFFSSGVLYDPMAEYNPFEVHSIYTVAGMEMGGDIRSFFLGENLYTNYIKDGDLISGRIPPCQEHYADDLCIASIDKSIKLVLGTPPIRWKNTVKIKNQRGSYVNKVSAEIENTSFYTGRCRFDNKNWDYKCADLSNIDMANAGFFAQGTLFYEHNDFTFTANQEHNLKQEVGLASGLLFNVSAVHANFVRNGEFFSTKLAPCLTKTALNSSIPLDAWDDYRPGLASDRNISTKIVNEPFTLVLASLKDDYTAYQNQSVSSNIYYDLYEKGTTSPIQGVTGGGHFDASKTYSVYSKFTVPNGYKDVFVGFKICSTNSGGINKLLPDDQCPATPVLSEDEESTDARWHVIKSTDHFAVRPKNIVISPKGNLGISKLRAGHDYILGLKAAYWDNSGTPRAVSLYNETLGQNDINETLILPSGDEDDPDNPQLKGQTSLNSATFVNGEADANLSFSDVGKVMIRFEDKDWAAVDIDDTPQSCDGGSLNNVHVPDGAFLCGAITPTFIPHHFRLANARLVNHNNGNYTYLGVDSGIANDDIDMSAHVDMTVIAENEVGAVTENFSDGLYENPVSVTLTVPDIIVNGINMVAFKHDLNEIDVPVSNIGFGKIGVNLAGTFHFVWNTPNLAERLNFNYVKDPAVPTQPFILNGANPGFDINVTSDYSGTKISGSIKEPITPLAGSATFQYVKVAPTKKLYPDIIGNNVITPIRVLVFCPILAPCDALGIDVAGGMTSSPRWWISTAHNNIVGGYGRIGLHVIAGGGVVAPAAPIQMANGINNNIRVTNAAAVVPNTVTIDTDPDTTDDWMLTNNSASDIDFIGVVGWGGTGNTGNVVGGQASDKKNNRLNW